MTDEPSMSTGVDQTTVTIGRATEGRITFSAPVVDTDGSGDVRLPVLVEQRGLSVASTIELESWGGGAPALVAFFDEMAAGWRGWHGRREWRDDGGSVSMRASHDGIGTIALMVSVMPFQWSEEQPGSWRLEAVVALDPGSLDVAARDLRTLLG
jgi:hypothetical protein